MKPVFDIAPSDSAQSVENLTYELRELIESIPPNCPVGGSVAVCGHIVDEVYYSYLKGDFEHVKSIYNGIEEDNAALRLAISNAAIAAAISMGDYSFFKQVESWLKSIIQAGAGPLVTASAEHQLSTAYISMGAYDLASAFMISGDFTGLPINVRALAAYLYTNYLNATGKHETALATARAYLQMLGECSDGVSVPDIYLRIHSATACVALGNMTDAENYLRGAMEKYLPYKAITPFAEHAFWLGGILEKLLKNEFPEYFATVMEHSGTVLKNWISFHNSFTGENIASILSAREYHIARLYSMGESYKEIAVHFGISEGRVRNIMQEIYRTLYIEGSDRRGKLRRLIW